MIETRFPIREVIAVSNTEKFFEPLNLTFSARPLSPNIGAALTGSGLYLISYFLEVGNYSGRYQIVSDNPQQCKRHQV